jgi:hypothetical protein
MMSQLPVDQLFKNHTARCAELTDMAEKELAAFFGAMTELFGSEEARLSAEAWLNELVATKSLPCSPETWRRFTVDASARLVNRLAPSGEALLQGIAVASR